MQLNFSIIQLKDICWKGEFPKQLDNIYLIQERFFIWAKHWPVIKLLIQLC